MTFSRGRNDPCWCGSGKKYKRCHLGRADDEAVNPWEMARAHRSAFSSRTCLAREIWNGDCCGKIVSAHTVPRAGSLAKIAREGHVYTFMVGLESLMKSGGKLAPELTGIREASTFYGFCQKHDNDLFAPLEKEDFVANERQCFLLAYRAFAKEIYNKQAQLEVITTFRKADRGRPVPVQMLMQHFVSSFEVGANAGIQDLGVAKRVFSDALSKADFSIVRAYVIELDEPPPVMCSAGFNPEYDFNGNSLQDLSDLSRTARLLTVSSFYGGKAGFIVLAWLADDDDVCRVFAESLASITDDELTDYLVALLFEYCENVQAQPTWWDSLAEGQRAALLKRMQSGADPTEARDTYCLKDPHLGLPHWGIRSRYWVG